MKADVDHELWRKINLVLVESPNMAVALSTMIDGMCSLLKSTGMIRSDDQARAHLAAMILSPNDRPAGSLLPLVEAELNKLRMD